MLSSSSEPEYSLALTNQHNLIPHCPQFATVLQAVPAPVNEKNEKAKELDKKMLVHTFVS